jgi:hypothetical protein
VRTRVRRYVLCLFIGATVCTVAYPLAFFYLLDTGTPRGAVARTGAYAYLRPAALVNGTSVQPCQGPRRTRCVAHPR